MTPEWHLLPAPPTPGPNAPASTPGSHASTTGIRHRDNPLAPTPLAPRGLVARPPTEPLPHATDAATATTATATATATDAPPARRTGATSAARSPRPRRPASGTTTARTAPDARTDRTGSSSRSPARA